MSHHRCCCGSEDPCGPCDSFNGCVGSVVRACTFACRLTPVREVYSDTYDYAASPATFLIANNGCEPDGDQDADSGASASDETRCVPLERVSVPSHVRFLQGPIPGIPSQILGEQLGSKYGFSGRLRGEIHGASSPGPSRFEADMNLTLAGIPLVTVTAGWNMDAASPVFYSTVGEPWTARLSSCPVGSSNQVATFRNGSVNATATNLASGCNLKLRINIAAEWEAYRGSTACECEPYYAAESLSLQYEWSIGSLVNYAASCGGGPGGPGDLPDNFDPAAAAILDRQTKPCAGCGG